jgi:predicted amidophosphoribosyltransferase
MEIDLKQSLVLSGKICCMCEKAFEESADEGPIMCLECAEETDNDIHNS